MRIFVALDSSPRATGVLAAAVKLAEQTNATLVLYRAIGLPPDMPRDLFAVTDLRVEEVLERNARSDLERLAGTVPKAHIEAIAVTFASPWDGICRTAREHLADLIMIGSHGYGGLDRILGTTASKVVNHADRNVLVVRNPM